MKSLKACLSGMVFMLLIAGMSYGSDSAYDQMNAISSVWKDKDPVRSDEDARVKAGQGFDDRSPYINGGGMQYIPVPKPKIEKTENNE
jgi:hypothetical protein